ncbi:Beta-Ig-H3/fasciclin [Flavobacteriaceae bacterium 3519-10]|nr:Beta-Ig-H3/fasciclin [Flavobacteriaceae bacterium 3519-10]
MKNILIMKNLLKLFAVALMFGFVMISCEESRDEMPNSGSIYDLASRDADLSNLKAAIDKAGLSTTLSATGTFTVFAPSNAAFTQFLSENGFASLNDVPAAALKEILLNHVLSDKVMAANVTTGYVSTMAKSSASSTRNLSMYINTASRVKINGISTVTQTDIAASNGVIHKVDKVIGLPTVVTHAMANPNFSILVSALTRNDMPNFAGILSGSASSPFTVFAPTNAAFTSLLTELTLPNLAAVPTAVLENALKYHVVAGANVASNDIVNNMTVTTFQGGTFKITTNGGVKITDANTRVANVIATDVQCSNGIIHVLDKVILP